MFASTGEKLADFDVFHPERMASRILGMGDVLTLIEQAEQTFDADQAEKMAGKLASREGFTLEDFLEQMMAIRKMGPIANLLGMLPGMGEMKEQLKQIDDRDLDRTAAIIRSMTPEERVNSKIINASRRVRIANGSGVSVTDVNQLLDRFVEAQKMMSQMAGSMGLPGMGPMSKKARGRQMQAQPRRARRARARAEAAPPAGRWVLPGCRRAAAARGCRAAARAFPRGRPARPRQAELRPAQGRPAGR